MARYPSILHGGRRGRPLRRTYIISALLVIFVVVAFIYRSSGKNKGGTVEPLTDANVVRETNPLVVVPPEPPEPPEPNLSDITPEPTTDPNPEATALIKEAIALVNAKPAKIIEARGILNDVLLMPMTERQRAFVKNRLSELADKWLFSEAVFPQDSLCSSYRVKRGDLLSTIGKQFKVPWELLMQVNEIRRPTVLPAGETIKVINGPFHAKVYLSTFTMDLYLQNNTFVKSFRVGLGRPGKETPTGLWCVKRDGKLIEPPWPDPVTGKVLHRGEPGYALGSRWIGLEGLKGNAKGRTGFGIHGTEEPETIGTESSRGCIRLHDSDVIFVYNLLVPVHSLIEVVE
ncbi:MAG: L,D-transpeptidase family protein [Planctomycetota bacterium]|jgi:hypothetical protein